jgi:hypothetical protein
VFYFTYSKNKQNKLLRNAFFVDILEAAAKKSRILIRNPVYGFKDPDPYQIVTDPENWLLLFSVADQDPDPYQNVTDPENWLLLFSVCFC